MASLVNRKMYWALYEKVVPCIVIRQDIENATVEVLLENGATHETSAYHVHATEEGANKGRRALVKQGATITYRFLGMSGESVERRNRLWEQAQVNGRTDDDLYSRLLEQEEKEHERKAKRMKPEKGTAADDENEDSGTKYPEHEKLKAAQGKVSILSEFWDFIGEQGWELAQYHESGERLLPLRKRPDEIIGMFLEIDSVKLEKDKQAILEEIRSTRPRKDDEQ